MKKEEKTGLGLAVFMNILVVFPAHAEEKIETEICSNLEECRKMEALIHEKVVAFEKALSTRIAYGRNDRTAVFIKDTSNPKLGDAWKDPSGMIWGDIVTAKQGQDYCGAVDGDKCFMEHKNAGFYCKSIGAQLPSYEDFSRLRTYLGGSEESPLNYQIQVLPNLVRRAKSGCYTVNVPNNFWSSSHIFDSSKGAYAFIGDTGDIGFSNLDNSFSVSVRCVSTSR